MKFAIVGMLNTVTTLFVYTILTRLVFAVPVNLTLAEAVAYGVGMIVSFYFNRRWTFREYWEIDPKEVLRFLTTNLSALLANVFIFHLLTNISHIYDIVAVLISAIFTVAWNFLLSKYWVFKK